MELFPVEVNRAPLELLLRVPGIGVTGAKRIVTARRNARIDFEGLRKLNIVLKRANTSLPATEKCWKD
jgi:predicted DNA-binding helix-hairpin-helix protein